MREAEAKREELERPEERLEALARLAKQVAEDAQREPERYLRDTVVPEGGE